MERTHYAKAEASYPWLGPLLETYHLTDEAIKEDLPLQKKKIPCKPGCCNCCINGIVPINKVEMAGISWFLVEQLQGQMRDRIIRELERFQPGQDKCPFLVDTQCGVYALRPLSCRTFYILGKPCEKGEDVSVDRMRDIYQPPRQKLKTAARPMLSLMGFKTPDRQDGAFEDGLLWTISHPLHELDWKSYLLTNVKEHDSAR